MSILLLEKNEHSLQPEQEGSSLQIIRKNEPLKNSTRFAAALLEKVGRKNAAEL